MASGHDDGIEELLPVTTVHDFGKGFFVENLAVRRSGEILVSVMNKNILIEIDPVNGNPARTVHTFERSVSGIVEVGSDVFYISSGTIGQAGSFAVFKVDLSDPRSEVVSRYVDVPEALLLNGSALLKGNIVLAVDSILGAVFAVDTNTAIVKKWLQHKALGKLTSDPNFPGVNGIKMHDGYAYMSSSEAKTIVRATVSSSGEATGNVDQVYDQCTCDDFTFDNEGSLYVTTHVFNSVVKIRKDGTRSRIAGGAEDVTVTGTTAAAFGRTAKDRTILYITTNGGLTMPVHGQLEPAKLLSIPVGTSEATDLRS